MKKFIIKLMLITTILSGIGLSFATVSALDCTRNDLSAKEQIQCGACDASGSTVCDPSTAPKSLSDTIKTVVEVLSIVAGAAAVIMIIVGGFRYVTSAGNPEQTKGARNTIVYALVGLLVVALAQLIVHFTLNSVSCVNGKTATGQTCTP
jgi:hypothetical protein